MHVMTLKLSDFAPELLHSAFRFCSPSDLASLSPVNYTFQQAAEYILYRHIHISFKPDLFTDTSPRSQAKKSFFYTLTTNSHKAALLRYLHVQLERRYSPKGPVFLLLEQLVDVLRNAHGLVDLRVMVYKYTDRFNEKLSEIIKSGYFQLHTLYFDACQDLEGIIDSQKHLQLLGIHENHYHFGYLNVSRFIKNGCRSQIDSSDRNFPGIFMLTNPGPSYTYNNLSPLTLFPELCLPGQAFTLCKDIATSLGQDFGTRYDVDHNRMLAIYVFDFSRAKTAVICEVVEAMAQSFVDCQAFSMWVKTSSGKETVSKPWRIPGLSTSISRFKQLQQLDFYVSSHDSLHQAADDLRSFLLTELVHTGLTVRACLDDYSMFAQLASDFGWDVVILDKWRR